MGHVQDGLHTRSTANELSALLAFTPSVWNAIILEKHHVIFHVFGVLKLLVSFIDRLVATRIEK